ncbi:hypothetical protein D3C75_907880 [compost metagenome]
MGDFDVRKGLVVLQKHIIAGMVLFDQVALEYQGFHIAFGDDIFEIGNFAYQLLRLDVMAAGKIRPHPVLQHLSLAHIDDGAFTVLHQITAGFVRQKSQLVADMHVFHKGFLLPVVNGLLSFKYII